VGHPHPDPAAVAVGGGVVPGACEVQGQACALQPRAHDVRSVIVVCAAVCGCFQGPRFDAPAGDDDGTGTGTHAGFVAFARTEFVRGCNDDGGVTCPPDAQRDGHETDVTVSAFLIQDSEITQGEYDDCVATAGCSAPQIADYAPDATPELPVRGVTYDDAQRYCSMIQARLPTEAEWECAAGACNGARAAYPWGEQAPSCALGNVTGCTGRVEAAHEAGATPRGVRDLGGNLREWVLDYYKNPYDVAPINPAGPDEGTLRVVRGGSFRSSLQSLRVWARDTADPSQRSEAAIGDIGFRCVVSDANT